MADPVRVRAERLFRELQASICEDLETLEGGATFVEDAWERPGGGGGWTRVLAEGAAIEKGAVNVSAVHGEAPPALVEHLGIEAKTFFATGISMIFHPRNPHAPTMHANLRYFEAGEGESVVSWFGGGSDLTPYYLYREDAAYFHRTVRDACDRHSVADYPEWKAWADRYFHNAHRGEARGVGGVFFDHQKGDADAWLAFDRDYGLALMPSYLPLLERRKDSPTTAEQERWHLQRRGRYVEFNLIHDRGTRFGLQTGGRTESILVSLPPRVRFDYMAEPGEGTPERELLDVLRGPAQEWL
ncbi:MAG: oxygen-dependent coproporphyrinogen oxidase [Planctomycetes bacterium]|nr:oxygen-dependent coproporphyrinogen oxidase [Planctomycetota bacterium]